VSKHFKAKFHYAVKLTSRL